VRLFFLVLFGDIENLVRFAFERKREGEKNWPIEKKS